MRTHPALPALAAPPALALPPEPEDERPPAVPLLGVLAPVGLSLVLWIVTGSALSLVFAALGPVVLVAGILDGRLRRRRARRRDERRYAERLRDLERSIDAAHATERRQCELAAGSARQRLGADAEAGSTWSTPEEPVIVSLGRAGLPSSLRLTPEPAGEERPSVTALRRRAATLPDAPLAVDLRNGLGILGSGVAADALLRAVLVQAVRRMPGAALDGPASAEPWLESLPHPVRRGGQTGVRSFVLDDGGTPARVTLADRTAEAIHSCRVVVEIAAGAGVIVRHPELGPGALFRPEAVTAAEAGRFAAAVAEVGGGSGLPARVPLRSLLASGRPRPAADGAARTHALRTGAGRTDAGPSDAGPARTLRCRLGIGRDGAVEVDLVGNGPHAVIAGTTGSGKSELLLSWVLALAAAHPPAALTFLLLDFKGGATFAPLDALPHTVGVITDLQPAAARRVVQSIAAELRFRERILAAAGLRSIDDGPSGLARLVLVVDEFAALAEQLPECHAVLTDVAARGRSLGMHLILSTQRPAGVVRDALLANAALRICLGVTSAEDSRALVGVPDAAKLRSPGRAVIALPAAPPQTVQVAEADDELIGEIAAASQRAPVRRPWLPELPRVLELPPRRAGTGLVFGLADLPEEQAQPEAAWDPARRASLLVLGAPGSGKSTALAALAAAHTAGDPERPASAPLLWPRSTVPCVWDAVESALLLLEDVTPALLLLDDIDLVLSAADGDHAHELAARLLRILRDGRRCGVAVALSAARLPAQLAPAGALIGDRLLLRTASRDEHVLAGGDAAAFDPRLPPGRGDLAGMRMQVALAKRSHVPPPERAETLHVDGGLLVVSTRPWPLHEALTAAGAAVERLEPGGGPGLQVTGAGTVLLGTPDDWQSRWGLLRQLAATHPVLLDGCAPSELRTMLGQPEPPPPCSGRPLWLVRPGEGAVRVRLEAGRTVGGVP